MKVNAIIIGAGRSGTTTLYKYLDHHPDVCFSSVKEVCYFSQDDLFARGDDYLHRFFDHAQNEKLFVSADTYLLIDYKAINRIYDYNPDMKIIVMLRDPVDRAYSSYQYAINYGYQKKNTSFVNSYKNEAEIIRNKSIVQQNNLGHFYSGLYHKHLSQWFRVFKRENVLILLTRELNKNRDETLKRLFAFLGLESGETGEPDIRVNKASKSKSKIIQQLLSNRELPARKIARKIIPGKLKLMIFRSGIISRIQKMNRQEYDYEPLSAEIRQVVREYFIDDSRMLEKEFGIRI